MGNSSLRNNASREETTDRLDASVPPVRTLVGAPERVLGNPVSEIFDSGDRFLNYPMALIVSSVCDQYGSVETF